MLSDPTGPTWAAEIREIRHTANASFANALPTRAWLRIKAGWGCDSAIDAGIYGKASLLVKGDSGVRVRRLEEIPVWLSCQAWKR